jgi:hypothetical protein
MLKDNFYLEKCKSLIEEKLSWGSSTEWQNQDFEALSQKIFEATKVNLSTTTLKRIWGKATYNSKPNSATLNALSAFVGYENWRAFTSNDFQPSEFQLEEKKVEVKSKKTYFIYLGAVVIVFFLGFVAWSFKRNTKKLIYQNIQFTSKPVTIGLPNSVIFKYDASDSNADSVFIQQSWDKRLRSKVNKFQNEYVCTYYRPGYYRAKLVLNDSIVKEHDVFVESDGWMGIIEKEPIPIYFPKKTIQKGRYLSITEEDVRREGIDLTKEIPWVCLSDVNKSEVVDVHNFYVETEIRNTYKTGDGVCQHTNIVLLSTNRVILIPLTIKGCVGELNLGLLGNKVKSKDLSVFGVDFNDWVKVRCEVKNGQIKVFVNNQLGFEGNQGSITGNIVGTRIRFRGAGEMKRFEIGRF